MNFQKWVQSGHLPPTYGVQQQSHGHSGIQPENHGHFGIQQLTHEHFGILSQNHGHSSVHQQNHHQSGIHPQIPPRSQAGVFRNHPMISLSSPT